MKNLFKTILNKPYNFLRNILKSHIENSYGMLIYYNSKEKVLIFDLVRKIKKETEMLLNYQEAYNIYSIVQAVEKIDGDIAEVGVFTGGSAKIMAEAKKTSNKALYLFDTFEGLPHIDVKNDPVKVYGGQFNASYENVKKYFE